jgi:hypothetical protein
MIVGIGGEMHAGKSTLAGAFAKIDSETFHIESWHPIGEVADNFHEQMPRPPEQNNIDWMNKWLTVLPAILKEVVHVDSTYEQLQFSQNDVDQNLTDYAKFFQHSVNLVSNPKLANKKIIEDNKSQYRPILQWLGGHLVARVKPTIWYDEIFDRIYTAQRSGAEHAIIGGVRYKSDFDSVKNEGGKVIKVIRPDMPTKDSHDPTERERNSWVPDITLYNTGDVEDLLTIAPVIWDDLKSNVYKSVYISKE